MTIAITGATGHLGRLVIRRLVERIPAAEIVALARNPQRGEDLGVAVREFDYDRPDTLAPALDGVDTLLLISASEIGKRARQHSNVVRAARKSGVERIVYTSLLHADRSSIDLAGEHRTTELEIEASGIPHVILRNGWYSENYTSSIPGALAGGAFLGCANGARISLAARADYADAAVAVLTGTDHDGKIYELAGDQAYTLSDLATELSRQTGRTIPYKDLSEAEYAAALERAGVPAAMARSIAGWDTAAARGALFDDSHQLSALIGRTTTPLAVSVEEALHAEHVAHV
ncbi:MAG TPA: SDR family oxidoreductase [Gemmatimonadaceae bacterium]|nr:SDR family oxidoreductase [Gemmatimonadaceae bacterium]